MLRTFGGLELVGSKVTRQRPLLLLAYLVSKGGRLKRSELAEGFYSPQVDRSDNLTTDLARLRQGGLPDCVVVDGGHLQVTVPSDYTEFRELLVANRVREAVERYRGPFLHGFTMPARRGRASAVDSSVETWVHSVRRETADAVLASLVLLIRQALARHDEAEAGQYAEQASQIVWDAEASPEAIGLIQVALARTKSSRAAEFAEQVRSYGVELHIAPAPAASPRLRAADSTLPVRLTSFEGRREELLDLMRRLRKRTSRVLTLTGAGGIGKSRLALELAHAAEQEDLYPDGVVFVELENVKFTGLVPIQVAKALRLELRVEEDAWRQVARALRDQRTLLVLDDLDHLPEVASELAAIVRECRDVQVLTTGRQPLRVEGEATYRLTGLLGNHADARDHDALSLFETRAKDVDPNFAVTANNRELVSKICRLVDGSPIGIEWAAGALATLSLTSLAAELTRSQDALVGTPHGSQRHQHPAALFHDSWQRLEANAKRALAALSLFPGGFTRAAAAAVAKVDLVMLTHLVEASLIEPLSDDRYGFQPLVRQQAAKELRRLGDLEHEVLARFRDHYVDLVRGLREAVGSRRYGAAAAALNAELPNVREAWRAEEDQQALFDYAVCLAPYMERRGLWDEQLELGAKALAAGSDHPEAAAVHYMLATVRHNRGELPAAEEHLRTALEATTDPRLKAEVLNAMGGVSYQLRRLDAARHYFESARSAFAELGAEAPLTAAINNLAAVEYQLGNMPAGMTHWEEALRRQQLAGDTLQQARTHNNIGMALRAQGELDQAAIHFDKALLLRERAHDTVGGMITQANIAGVRYEQGDFAAAERIYQQLLKQHEAMGDRAGQALSLNDLAAIDEQLGRLNEARQRLLEAELIQDEIQDATNLVTTLNNLALVELSAGNGRRAAVYADRALTLAESTGNLAASVYSITYKAAAKVLANEPDTATELLERAMALAADLNLQSARLYPLLWAARAQAGGASLDLAEGYAREAVTLANELGHKPMERQAVKELAQICERREQWSAAAPLLNRLLELDIALRHPDLDDDKAWLHEVSGRAAQHEHDGGTATTASGRAES